MAFDSFALILAMVGLGMAFARLRALPVNAAETLNLFVLNVCLPAAVLVYVPRLRFDPALLGVVATPWLLAVATVALVATATRLFGFRRDAHAVLLLCVGLCNSSFVGYPMVRALLGEQALPYAVVYDQFGVFLLLSTFGLLVLARYGGDRPPGARAVLLRIAKFPPLWALAFALALMPESPPGWIAAGLQRLVDAMLPLVMFAIGLGLRLRIPREDAGPLATGLVLKLLVMPVLALGLSLAFGMRGDMLAANVLESAMPAMVTAAALAISHQLAPRLASALVAYGLLLSLVTLPAWAWLLGRIAG